MVDENEWTCVLLAGGQSSRMGQPKGTLKFDGTFWLEQQLQRLAQCGIKKVVLVLGYDNEIYRQEFSWMQTNAWLCHLDLKIKVIINTQPERGSFSSLQCGLKHIGNECFVLPIDTPCPKPFVWANLEKSKKHSFACIPEKDGKGGHPVLLSKEFIKSLMIVSLKDRNARLDTQLRILKSKVRVKVEDSRIHENLNTLQDWKFFLRQP